MAHLINYDERKGTHSFASHSEKAWHGLGQVVDNAMTAEEAINLANLDYEVYKTTIHPLVDGMPNNGDAIEDKFAIMRQDNNAYLGLVGSRYEIVQNRDAFGFFDAIVDSGEAIFETAGSLGKGERIFVTAKLPDDMLVGSVNVYNIKGNNISATRSSEGSGGVYFVTKFGQVWAFRKKSRANTVAKLLNESLEKNGGKTWEVVAENAEPNYVSCVQYVPETDGKEVFAVSTNGFVVK